MALRFLVYGLILVSVTACDPAPRIVTSSVDLQKEILKPDTFESSGTVGHAAVDLTVKFDKTPHDGRSNVGVAYYRVDFSNPSNHTLSLGAVYVQFEDAMKIAIRKCRLQGPDVSQYGFTSIRVKPGEKFSASSSCEFPISQMDLVEDAVSLVDFNFIWH